MTYGYDEWTFFLMRSGPTPIVLTIGIWICVRNRFRRPMVARAIGAVMAIELLIYCVQGRGLTVLSWLFIYLRQSNPLVNTDEMMRWSNFIQTVCRVIYNFLYAGIWGTALAGALYVERADTEQNS